MATPNLNKLDRQIRLVVGVSLIMLGGMKTSFLIAIVGLAIFLTGLYAYCPVYKRLGIDNSEKTPPKKSKTEE